MRKKEVAMPCVVVLLNISGWVFERALIINKQKALLQIFWFSEEEESEKVWV